MSRTTPAEVPQPGDVVIVQALNGQLVLVQKAVKKKKEDK